MDQDKKYSVLQNLAYCIRATRQGCPKLLLFCALIIPVNCLVPVITAFLPKIIIEGITEGKPPRGCWPLRRHWPYVPRTALLQAREG